MSLTVYLNGNKVTRLHICDSCGHEHECTEIKTLYRANITHNLVQMANAAGIYAYIWQPDDVIITNAGEMIPYLEEAIKVLLDDPVKYRKLNQINGWGSYEGLLGFVNGYLEACKKYPGATIEVCT